MTSSIAPIKEPLSEEDLELLELLDASSSALGTSTIASADVSSFVTAATHHSEFSFGGEEMRESVGAALAESVESASGLIAPVRTTRGFTPGDVLMVRGERGHRVGLDIDGISLRHALSTPFGMEEWSSLDPWFLERGRLRLHGSMSEGSEDFAGHLAVVALEPPSHDDELGTELEVSTHSADRSTAVHGAVSGKRSFAGIRVGGGYSDHRALRVRTASSGGELDSAYQRAAMTARARLWGGPTDRAQVYLGVDVDRLLNVRRLDFAQNGDFLDRKRARDLAFLRIDAGGSELDFSLTLARHSFRTESGTPASTDNTGSESVDSHRVGLAARAKLLPTLRVNAGFAFELDDAVWAGAVFAAPRSISGQGDTRRAEGYLSFEFDRDWIEAAVATRLANQRSVFAGEAASFAVEATRLISSGHVWLPIFGALAIRGGWTESLHVPTLGDLRLRATEDPLRAETARSLEVGPSVRATTSWVDVVGFASWIDDAIEVFSRTPPRTGNVDEVRVVGAELAAGWLITDRLQTAASVAWSQKEDPQSAKLIGPQPIVSAKVSFRYDFSMRNAFVELRTRATSESFAIARRTLDAQLPGYLRIGIGGGGDLGAGFRFYLTLENVLDGIRREPESPIPSPGVDLRAALVHSWP